MARRRKARGKSKAIAKPGGEPKKGGNTLLLVGGIGGAALLAGIIYFMTRPKAGAPGATPGTTAGATPGATAGATQGAVSNNPSRPLGGLSNDVGIACNTAWRLTALGHAKEAAPFVQTCTSNGGTVPTKASEQYVVTTPPPIPDPGPPPIATQQATFSSAGNVTGPLLTVGDTLTLIPPHTISAAGNKWAFTVAPSGILTSTDSTPINPSTSQGNYGTFSAATAGGVTITAQEVTPGGNTGAPAYMTMQVQDITWPPSSKYSVPFQNNTLASLGVGDTIVLTPPATGLSPGQRWIFMAGKTGANYLAQTFARAPGSNTQIGASYVYDYGAFKAVGQGGVTITMQPSTDQGPTGSAQNMILNIGPTAAAAPNVTATGTHFVTRSALTRAI